MLAEIVRWKVPEDPLGSGKGVEVGTWHVLFLPIAPFIPASSLNMIAGVQAATLPHKEALGM